MKSATVSPALLLIAAGLTCQALSQPQGSGDYQLTDPNLKVVAIDSDPNESFLSLQLDSAGRLFAGCREALFVYEPDPAGLYKPRQLLYRFPKSSWVSDIAIRGNDLYVITHSAVYFLEGAVTRREGLQPKRLLWGAPMLPSFQEHQGLHGLVIGPDGDLYVSSGDNVIRYGDYKRPDHWGYWTYFHGKGGTPYVGSGGVMKITPDGSGFSVVARGTRNSCGLAFDANWNLFTNDNDHESMPEQYVPGRLLHVTPHAYFSWPRGWMIEKQPWRGDLLDTLNPALGRYVPTGETYYDETFLPEKYRRNLLVAEWGKAVVPRYPLRSQGATFKADEYPFFSGHNTARPVGVAVGRGGRIFVACLYMAANEASPVCRSEIVMITRATDPPQAPFEAYEETRASTAHLFAELENPSWQRQYRAHIELMRRGGQVLQEAATRLDKSTPGSALQTHLIWLAAAGGAHAKIAGLAAGENASASFQALRALARFGTDPADYTVFEKALGSPHPQAAHAALAGIFDRFDKLPFGPVAALARSSDSYLRQIAAQLLARRASMPQLQKLVESTDAKDRMAGIVALGFRLTLPPATKPLPASFPLDINGFSFNPHVTYADGEVDLRQSGVLGTFTIADVWARHSHTAEEETITALLEREMNDPTADLAKQAAFFLRLLKDPRYDARASALLGIPLLAAKAGAPIKNAVTTGATELPEAFKKLDWNKEVTHGDAKKGQQLFLTRGCALCHSIKQGDPGGGAPSLVGVGTRFNVQYLVESVMVPNKVVAPAFRWTLATLKNHETVAGLVTGETRTDVEFLLPAGVHRTVKKAEIARREIQERSPMPEGLIQTPGDLRDLVAFLALQKDANTKAPAN